MCSDLLLALLQNSPEGSVLLGTISYGRPSTVVSDYRNDPRIMFDDLEWFAHHVNLKNVNMSHEMHTKVDEYGGPAEHGSPSSVNYSFSNFSFKNLSQLASINYDFLTKGLKDDQPTKPNVILLKYPCTPEGPLWRHEKL
ncbi:hypothetical protein L1987_20736 [Smallanthus sonchifolius]|uniref:Uncharacterized protein n=1 Tax=Smallanthus sonchifolius TaxID=185202 RepID=A0ACB9IUA7_9ASTR|nr:hypothetical protein L1987_20736 [Smallanthus sonchifolius]